MNELIENNIQNKIYIIRGQQVMLDSDLAELYGYEVKRLNEQVKRNIERFPSDFMFQLTNEELSNLWSQIATANINSMSRSNPYAFTEQGVYMLATVLKSEIAVKKSIFIMRTFKEMRHFIYENKTLLNNPDVLKIASTLVSHDNKINELEKKMATKEDINEIMEHFINVDRIKEYVILKGEVFEANVAYTNIYKQANKSIYIVDDYINIDTLNLLKCKRDNVEIIIFSENKGKGKSKLTSTEYNNFKVEYPPIEIKHNSLSHDRYIILDYDTNNERIYHCGASSKDAGKKVCGINEIDNISLMKDTIELLLKENNLIL